MWISCFHVTILIISGVLAPVGMCLRGPWISLSWLKNFSLIAIMLGRLRMSVPQVLAIYREVGETIFGRKRRRALAGINILAARYNYKNVEKVVKSTVQKHCKIHTTGTCMEDKLIWKDDEEVDNYWHLCQSYVTIESSLWPWLTYW